MHVTPGRAGSTWGVLRGGPGTAWEAALRPASSPRATRVLTQLAHFEDLTQHLGQLDATAAEGTLVLVFAAAVLKHNLQAGRGRSQRAELRRSRATATQLTKLGARRRAKLSSRRILSTYCAA